RSASRRASRPARAPSPNRPKTSSERPPRGGIRYGLRPSRLPPRAHHHSMEVNEPPKNLHLSTADYQTVGYQPRLNIRSARWLKFESAPTLSSIDRGSFSDMGLRSVC